MKPNFLHYSCAVCGKTFDRPRLSKRACSSSCRSKLHRLGLANAQTLREAIERFAHAATDEQWEDLMAFARTATDEDWIALVEQIRTGPEKNGDDQ